MKFAASTLILPELSFAQQITLVRDLGYDGLTLRIDDRPAAKALELRSAAASSALEWCALATDVAIVDAPAFETLARSASTLGASLVRVTAPAWDGTRSYDELFAVAIAGLDRIEAVAREQNVRAVVELRPGTITPSPSAARRMVEGFDPAHVGVSLDPGGMIHEGFEPWDLAVAMLGPWLAHVSVTNAVWSLRSRPAGGPYGWEPQPARLREGQADWRSILSALSAAGYDGWLTVEDVTAQPAREKLDDALTFLKDLVRAGETPNTGSPDAVESGGR